jgi:acyl-CoA reductase-like NAD-dependent aldehyde dehydrogenase
VHFTGSTRAGRAINELVAPRFARAALEMGGVNAAVVFADADLAAAAQAVVASGTALAGQKCTAIRRILVHRDAADRFTDELRTRIESLVVGAPDDRGAHLGPMVSPAARRTAQATVSEAVQRGGEVVATGRLAAGIGAGDDSAYFAPVLLTALAEDDPLTREEVFAPILVLDTFTDDDDVWARVNASGYGLAARSTRGTRCARPRPGAGCRWGCSRSTGAATPSAWSSPSGDAGCRATACPRAAATSTPR